MEAFGVKMLLFSEDDTESIHPRLCAGAPWAWEALAACKRVWQAGPRGAIQGDLPISFQTMTRMR